MKKILAGFLVTCSCTGLLFSAQKRVDKTFFMPKSQGLDTPMELKTWNKGIEDDDRKGIGANVSVTPFYERSVNGYDVARYFLYNGLNSMKFATLATDANSNVDPRHFGLNKDFEGKFSIRPQRYSTGARIDYYQNLDRWLDGLFLSVGVPVVHTSHKTQYEEEVTTAGSATNPNSIFDAWSGGDLTASGDWAESFKFHKMKNSHDDETGVAEVDVKLGIRFLNKEDYRLGVHLNFLVPTGSEPKGSHIWEAVVGNGQHFGLGAGLDGWYSVWEHEYKRRSVHTSSHHRFVYLFESTETRTLELKNKQWGRFIRMRKQDPTDVTKVLAGAYPGVNALTREVEVEPGIQYDATFELHAHLDQFTLTFGYNWWLRQQEELNLKHAFTHGAVYGLSSENGTLANAEIKNLAISSNTTIKKFEPANGVWLTESDVEVSGHVAAQSHKFFGTVDYEFDWKYPMWALFGGSYQLAIKNTALEQWSVWGSLGASF